METRHTHPYWMYEEIQSQPSYVRSLLDDMQNDPLLDRVTQVLLLSKRVFFTGCGTSYYTAKAGSFFAHHVFQEKNRIQSVPAFELLHHWKWNKKDAVVLFTHSGETHLALELLEKAKKDGVPVIVITGLSSGSAAKKADYVLFTGYEQEKSFAHTISYTLGATMALLFVHRLAEKQASPVEIERIDSLPDMIEAALQAEASIQETAKRFDGTRRWIVAGSGPGIALAEEIALKAVETCHIPALGLDFEQVFHGYLPMCDSDSLLIVTAVPGNARDRLDELLRAAEKIHLPVLLSSSSPSEKQPVIPVADCPEIFVPIVYVVSFHLFVYFVSVFKGLNPDWIRRDQPSYLAARKEYR
ncbi:SIS domain-containing protein [Desmospora profundinema]|uniref:Glutamine--fructose-6-phosphate aminotransferase [isomerizing] n=1 Tax=Desmospora profundinema TaxID=1571184 RepID=A0ABU1IRD4_9BACL|nr:SIS domain-containing protein [Desmospora profundinema]MDR6227357.1 glucosamine 6-phosphate synthetase-like amidotransferase/phosphosugar isomerase protein [Desmospora profundinema]